MTQLILSVTILCLSTLAVANHNSRIQFPEESALAEPVANTYEHYVDLVIARGVGKLCLEINKKYQETKYSENIVFAPLDIAGVLGLILLGSNGNTFHELANVLGLATGLEIENNSERIHEQFGRIIRKIETSAIRADDQQITFAGAIFVQNNFPIRKLYKETAENLYHFEIFNLDFQTEPSKSLQYVNAWVSDRTKGKITEVLSEPPSTATKLILASAMYFQAKWEYPFLEGTTARRPFYPNGRKSPSEFEVEMMANAGRFPYYKDHRLGCEIIGLPYKGNGTVMYVIIPFDSNIQKLKEFENRITEADLEYLAEKTVVRKVIISIPKMKLESTINLKSVLIKLGVTSLFDPELANLGLISPGKENIPVRQTNDDSVINPLTPFRGNPNDVIIFSRSGNTVNCSSLFDHSSNTTTCEDTVAGVNGEQKVVYKKFGDKIGRRVVRDSQKEKIINRRTKRTLTSSGDTIDNLRHLINKQSTDNNYQNPGLYVDQVIHKVYMQITETGTEAASTTIITIPKSYDAVSFRVDIPFVFFIRHEDTKTIMFWGSVDKPTPNFNKGS